MRPDLGAPVLFWAQVIAPGNVMFYHGTCCQRYS
jgi:hypothetical protein